MDSKVTVPSALHDSNTSHGNIERRMPYLGRILKYEPNSRIDVGYTLDLHEDLYLTDHMLVHAPGIKEPSACLPILPMTFGLEMMAEAASCLAPGFGLIGLKNVTASSWVDFKDVTTLSLVLSARVDRDNPRQMSRKIKVEIFKEGAAFPAMKCDVILGRRYILDLTLRFEELLNPRPLSITIEQLYRDRFLFHGPLLHCVSKIHAVGENGLIGEVRLLQTGNLFRSTTEPELLTHPSFMDGVAQLMVVWSMSKECQALPIGIDTIEIYRPIPEPGQSLPIYLQITKKSYKTISINLEIHDGDGNVWMRIKNWKYWIFYHNSLMKDFIRLPEKFFASRAFPGSPKGTVGREISIEDLKDVDLDWLARTVLHTDEMHKLKELKKNVLQMKAWLLERLVAKDAVRQWIAAETSDGMMHPASFCLETDLNNTLSVKSNSVMTIMPKVTKSRSKDHAIAIAHKEEDQISLETLKR
jgi:hypothetical protein